jgi:uncharacterized protein YbaR (Trm112 family)
MVSPQLLGVLRCPLDPRQPLADHGDRLECDRCRAAFPVRGGVPALLAEEILLPDGCTDTAQLPCQRERGAGQPG